MPIASQPFPRKVFRTGEVIFREGNQADCMYVIRTGKVEIYLENDGKKKSIMTMGANCLFGEMAVIDNKPRSASAIALEKTECLVFYKKDLSKRMESLDPFMRALIKVLVNTVREANKHRESN